MPTPGKSLVGFMDLPAAIQHFQNACVRTNPNDVASMQADWQAAQALLGPPIPNAGNPQINPIPGSHQAYIAALTAQPWMANAMQGALAGCSFQLVEIDPLLAFQFSVDASRSHHHCAPFGQPPTLDELLNTCLPHTPTPDPVYTSFGPASVIMMSRSLNFYGVQAGLIQPAQVAGLQVGFSLPLVHVVRLNGRCYLHNGFHRTYGARIAGATHIPCVFRDVPDAAAAGITPHTFPLQLMESANPPTVGHFTQGRAWDVQLRGMFRTLHVSWAEYVVPAE